MDLMDAPVEDGAMPSPSDMGVGLDQEIAAFDAAVNKRRDGRQPGNKNQAEENAARAARDGARSPIPGPHAGESREGQVKMEQMAATASRRTLGRVSLVNLQADAVAAAGTSRMRRSSSR